MTRRQWLNDALKRLSGPDASLEAMWMLSDAIGETPSRVRLGLQEPLSDAQCAQLETWLRVRETGMPLGYAQGRAYFMGYEFTVDARVLIPRQDTELLCECTIERARRACPDVLELCTGSGAVAISVKLKCSNARVTATDLSADALDVARGNAQRHGVQIEFLQGDFFEPVRGCMYDVIACNPPYLSAPDMQEIASEVQCEPREALYGGEDGLDFYRRAALVVRGHLKKGGCALFEVGAGQAEAVAQLLGGACEIYEDLNHIQRVVALTIEG